MQQTTAGLDASLHCKEMQKPIPTQKQAYILPVLHAQGLAMSAVSLSRIVAGCCQSGECEEAYAGWVMMQAAGLQPDAACLNALLAALRGAKQWQHAVHVFQAARQAQVAQGLLCCAVGCLCCITHAAVAITCTLGTCSCSCLCPALPCPVLPCLALLCSALPCIIRVFRVFDYRHSVTPTKQVWVERGLTCGSMTRHFLSDFSLPCPALLCFST